MITINLNSSNLHELDILKTAEPQSIVIECIKTTHDTIDHLINLLKNFGAAIHSLKMELLFPSTPYNHDLTDFDFVTACPNLEELYLVRCNVNSTILKHQKIKKLTLKELWLHTDSVVNIGVEENSALESFQLHDCNWCDAEKNSITKLSIGAKSALKRFEYSLDEDYVECNVELIEINDVPFLEDVYVNVHLYWTLAFAGIIPKLRKISTHSGRYAAYNLDFTKVKDGSSAYLTNLRNGNGAYAGEVYVFMGESNYFDQDKMKSLIQVLGGKIQHVIDENVTHVCLLGDLSDEWLSEELVSEELIALKALTDAGQEIEVIDQDYVTEYFEDWY